MDDNQDCSYIGALTVNRDEKVYVRAKKSSTSSSRQVGYNFLTQGTGMIYASLDAALFFIVTIGLLPGECGEGKGGMCSMLCSKLVVCLV